MATEKLTLADGSSYEGEAVNGIPHGKGKLTSKHFVYEGDFYNGIMHGKGKRKWNVGAYEEGDFANGEMHGFGTHTVYEANGFDYTVTEGKWENGIPMDCKANIIHDFVIAFPFYKEAAEKGDANAMLEIGINYIKGQGVEQSYSKGYEWVKKAADSGNEKAKKMLIEASEPANRNLDADSVLGGLSKGLDIFTEGLSKGMDILEIFK